MNVVFSYKGDVIVKVIKLAVPLPESWLNHEGTANLAKY